MLISYTICFPVANKQNVNYSFVVNDDNVTNTETFQRNDKDLEQQS